MPVVADQRIQGGEHHARVIRPSAGRLIMRAVSDHVCAGERVPVLEFVWHTQCIADCLPVDGRAKLFDGFDHS